MITLRSNKIIQRYIMKNLTPLFKISLLLLLLLSAAITVYITQTLSQVEGKTYSKLSQQLIQDLKSEEELSENIGITNALLIADNNRIRQALVENRRDIAIDELKTTAEKFKKSTKIKNLKIHIHTADVRSFVRNWKLDKFGDPLSGFRKTIVNVKETLKPVFSFEVGRIGLTLRSIVPILQGEKYLGSLEFIQNFDSVAKKFAKKRHHHLLLMNDSLLYIATDLKDAPAVDHYKLCTHSGDDDFLKAAQGLDIDKLAEEKVVVTDQYLFTYKYIKDMRNNNVGMHLMGMSTLDAKLAVQETKQSTYILIGISLFLIALVFFILLITQKQKSRF